MTPPRPRKNWRDLPKGVRNKWLDQEAQIAAAKDTPTSADEVMTDADFAMARAFRDGAGPAPRKPPAQRERDEVQRPLVNHLRKHLPAGSIVFAVTNHARSKMQIMALIRDGMKVGLPDIGIITAAVGRDDGRLTLLPPRLLMIECKHPDGGVLSEAQKHTQSELRGLGVPVLAECRSVEQALEWLRKQGVEIK